MNGTSPSGKQLPKSSKDMFHSVSWFSKNLKRDRLSLALCQQESFLTVNFFIPGYSTGMSFFGVMTVVALLA
jgi:hypothetical protein